MPNQYTTLEEQLESCLRTKKVQAEQLIELREAGANRNLAERNKFREEQIQAQDLTIAAANAKLAAQARIEVKLRVCSRGQFRGARSGMGDMKHLFCGMAAVGTVLAYVPAAFAQAEWSSVAKRTNGQCGETGGEGAVANVTERPGTMHLKLVYPNGKQYADFDVALAANGSGKSEFQGAFGPTIVEVPAGSGKRPFKTAQAKGICQWLWTPR